MPDQGICLTMTKRIYTPKMRKILRAIALGRCHICKEPLSLFHADHIKPFSKGGETTIENGQALCPKCNLRKGANYEEPEI